MELRRRAEELYDLTPFVPRVTVAKPEQFALVTLAPSAFAELEQAHIVDIIRWPTMDHLVDVPLELGAVRRPHAKVDVADRDPGQNGLALRGRRRLDGCKRRDRNGPKHRTDELASVEAIVALEQRANLRNPGCVRGNEGGWRFWLADERRNVRVT